MSRIVRFHEIGGPEVLKLEDVQVGPPAADEVRIAVKAIGINRAPGAASRASGDSVKAEAAPADFVKDEMTPRQDSNL